MLTLFRNLRSLSATLALLLVAGSGVPLLQHLCMQQGSHDAQGSSDTHSMMAHHAEGEAASLASCCCDTAADATPQQRPGAAGEDKVPCPHTGQPLAWHGDCCRTDVQATEHDKVVLPKGERLAALLPLVAFSSLVPKPPAAAMPLPWAQTDPPGQPPNLHLQHSVFLM